MDDLEVLARMRADVPELTRLAAGGQIRTSELVTRR